MSEIKALEELREYAAHNCRIKGWKDDLRMISDRVEAEITARFMELPCDADGVPIKPGDMVRSEISKRKRVWMVSSSAFAVYGDPSGYNPKAFKHVKPRTLEYILEEYGAAFEAETDDIAPLVDRYADEIRELMGGLE